MLRTLAAHDAKLIASGGVSAAADIEKFAEIAREHDNLDGVIVGKAIYERKVDLSEIIKLTV